MPSSQAHSLDGRPADEQISPASGGRLPQWGRVETGYRLPNPLLPLPGESLPSLIMRNAAKYQLRNPRLLLNRLSPPAVHLHLLCQVEAGEPEGEALRELLGVDGEAWGDLAMGTGDARTVRLTGHVVSRELARVDRRHVCPQCLASAPIHRTSWFFDALPVCTEHRSRFLANCPRCKSPLRWRGSGVHLCGSEACNFDLRRAEGEPVPEEELVGVHALLALFNNQHSSTAGHLPLPFGEALRLAMMFGQLDAGLSIAGGLDSVICHQRQHIHEIVARGWRVLNDWPQGFHRLLDGQVARAASRPGKVGLRKLFGYLSARIFAWQREPWGKPIAEAFALYISSRPDMPITAHVISRFGSAEALEKRNLTLNEASRMLEVSGQTMLQLAERHGLFLVAPQGSGLPSLLSAEKVAGMREILHESLLFEEGRQIVGVGRSVLEQLEEARLVHRVAEGRVVDSQVFRRSEIETFVAACRGNAPSVTIDAAKKGKLVTIAGMVRGGRSYPDICGALVNGKLEARGLIRNVAGLGAIRLCPEEVRRALPNSSGTMSAVDVGKHLRVAHRFIRHWARCGYLAAAPSEGTGDPRLRFLMEDVERFSKEYMLGGEVAEASGTPGAGTFSRHMRFMGVHPLSSPDVDGCDGTLFRRTDITPEVLQEIAKRRVGDDFTLKEYRARCSAQVHAAINTLHGRLGPGFKRVNNRLEDFPRNCITQVISGRRQTISGAYRFKLNRESLDRLMDAKDANVALVPDQGTMFIHVPIRKAMAFATPNQRALALRFDPHGVPLDLAEYALSLKVEELV